MTKFQEIKNLLAEVNGWNSYDLHLTNIDGHVILNGDTIKGRDKVIKNLMSLVNSLKESQES